MVNHPELNHPSCKTSWWRIIQAVEQPGLGAIDAENLSFYFRRVYKYSTQCSGHFPFIDSKFGKNM